MHKEGAFSIIRKCSIHISQVYHCLFISSISLLIAFVHLIYLVLKETNMRIVVYYFFFSSGGLSPLVIIDLMGMFGVVFTLTPMFSLPCIGVSFVIWKFPFLLKQTHFYLV